MSIASFPAWPTRILTDQNAAEAVPGELDRLGARRAFILASSSLSRPGGPIEAIGQALGGRLAGIASSIPAHTPLPAVLGAAAEARACGADAIVSIGGGSVIDAGKLVQAALADALDDLQALMTWRSERHPVPRKPVGHIAVPTTLSGAEFTWFAGARNPETGLKLAFGARWLMPGAILFDTALSLMTPNRLWLSTGIRAVDHAVETLMSDQGNPFAETLALQGLRRLLKALSRSAADPADREARGSAQIGAWFCAAGLMSGVPMGASHAFGHVIGSLFDVPHGITSCVMLPAVMQFNGEAVHDRLDRLADVLGEDPVSALRWRVGAMGLPTRLSEIGIGPGDFARIADGLEHEAWLRTNPRPVGGRTDIERILAMAG